MRCLFWNVHYLRFINSYYEKNPGLELASYEYQKAAMNATFFGDGDLYTEGLRAVGWEADDLVQNCGQLQNAWARENGYTGNDIILEQIRRYKPDVLFSQATFLLSQESHDAIRQHVKLIVGQQATPVRDFSTAHWFDIVFTAYEPYIEKFAEVGVDAHYLPYAFESRVLDHLDVKERDLDVTFVGQVTGLHVRRRVLLEHMSNLGIDCWGPEGTEFTGNRYHGEAWGMDMFNILARSKITINCTIDDTRELGDRAGNMRLYEGTGCGALMVTEYRPQLDKLFEKDVEVVAYRNPEECMYLVRYYLAHPDEAAKIAKRGQERTLKDHTYTKRMEYVAGILEDKLRRI